MGPASENRYGGGPVSSAAFGVVDDYRAAAQTCDESAGTLLWLQSGGAVAVIRNFADHDNAFREDVRRALVGQGHDDTSVRDVRVSLFEDLTGSIAWRVTLVVPRPRGETWNVEQTLDLKDAARRTTDEIAESYELVADGVTSVVLAVEDATADEVAVDAGPEPGERPDDPDDDVP